MPWCPECKLEYVAGIKVCPDCKKALVDSLDDVVEETIELAQEYEDMYEEPEEETEVPVRIDVKELVKKVQAGEMSPDEFNDLMAQLRVQYSRSKEYRYRKDLYDENKSSVLVLLIVGLLGLLVLLLNAVGVFHLPFSGFSLVLTNVVMGLLFAVFVFSGIKASIKAKKLLPEVNEEKELIEKCVAFLKEQKAAGAFVINEEVSFEEESLLLSNLCMDALENNFDNLEDGFSFFVTDRYFSEIFDESTME